MLCFNRIFIPEDTRRASIGFRCVADTATAEKKD